ncbi:MAG: protein-disulfide reductase DsbD N-terminal domain-containing protein [Planctomycetota bacterium]|nr:protein-disulfide reductase DsbD N-terminal domain-containing protein [Planctomycetota bacterium]
MCALTGLVGVFQPPGASAITGNQPQTPEPVGERRSSGSPSAGETSAGAISGSSQSGKQATKAALRARPTLFAEHQSLIPGEVNWLAIEFEIDAGWHTYWLGQNDTGEAPSFVFRLPPGFEVGEAVWPAPTRYEAEGDFLDHTYEGRVAALFPLKVPSDAPTSVTIEVDADWLVCDKICLPENTTLSTTLGVATTGERPQKASTAARPFAETRSRRPTGPTLGPGLTKIEPGGKTIVAEVALAGDEFTLRLSGAREVILYPDQHSTPLIDLLAHGVAKGEMLKLELDRRPGAGPKDGQPRVSGIVEALFEGTNEPVFYHVDTAAKTDHASRKVPSP